MAFGGFRLSWLSAFLAYLGFTACLAPPAKHKNQQSISVHVASLQLCRLAAHFVVWAFGLCVLVLLLGGFGLTLGCGLVWFWDGLLLVLVVVGFSWLGHAT